MIDTELLTRGQVIAEGQARDSRKANGNGKFPDGEKIDTRQDRDTGDRRDGGQWVSQSDGVKASGA